MKVFESDGRWKGLLCGLVCVFAVLGDIPPRTPAATQDSESEGVSDPVDVDEKSSASRINDESCQLCRTYDFRLVDGNHPVCPVYVERLESTPVRHPYCTFEFPEEFKGISSPPRQRLSVREVFSIQREVMSFDWGVPNSLDHDPRTPYMIELSRGHRLDAWALDSVDVDRDQTPERVLLWLTGACWGDEENLQSTSAYILEPDRLALDWEKTRRLLLRPQDEWVSPRYRDNWIANDIDVFEYQGRAYISGQRSAGPRSLFFDVYEYRGNGFERICSAIWEDEE